MANFTTSALVQLDRLLHRFPNDRLICSLAFLAGNSPRIRSMLIGAAIEHAQPGWRSLDLIHEFGGDLPVRTFLSALTAGQRTLTRKRISLLSNSDRPQLPHLNYAQAMLTRQFVEAFGMWTTFPEVETRLRSLPLAADAPSSHTMAVVLPGPADSDHGTEIDAHDFVGRTGLTAPPASDAVKIGTRFDYAFLSWHRFEEIRRSVNPMKFDVDHIVTSIGHRHRSMPSWLTTDVGFELEKFENPTSSRTYLPLRIVPWCLERGIRPTLYCADFYLGATSYQSADYDSMRLLETEDDHLLSYLRHDVFFNHAALRHWNDQGAILARGRLAELLALDGRSFAEVLQQRWGSR